jgi:hypothetical protein
VCVCDVCVYICIHIILHIYAVYMHEDRILLK